MALMRLLGFARSGPDDDWEARERRLVARLQDLEDRMDRDEATRKEWVGTVKRVLARINKASERAEEPAQNGDRPLDNSFAEAQRLGLFGPRTFDEHPFNGETR